MASRTPRTRRRTKKRGLVGRVFDRLTILVEAAERVPTVGRLLGSLIKLFFVLVFFGLVLGLMGLSVFVGLYLQELAFPSR